MIESEISHYTKSMPYYDYKDYEGDVSKVVIIAEHKGKIRYYARYEIENTDHLWSYSDVMYTNLREF